jgi:PII-like signaling protein
MLSKHSPATINIVSAYQSIARLVIVLLVTTKALTDYCETTVRLSKLCSAAIKALSQRCPVIVIVVSGCYKNARLLLLYAWPLSERLLLFKCHVVVSG